ncbi:hypothetical protein ACTWLT_31345 [Micromonospora sp. ZYX-F-536]|uniref:hypothetical protein n=1 Tax=Micromonospora sp. ZYX-F-536 TaxID=3457629 RepID=UPI004040993C
MRDSDPTDEERTFFSELLWRVPGLHDWYHEDPDGTPWIVASYDFVVGDHVHKTLRLDYDGTNLRGGWSPACLNWDDGVRADEALIDTAPPDGLRLDGVDPGAAAVAASSWFAMHLDRWEQQAR